MRSSISKFGVLKTSHIQRHHTFHIITNMGHCRWYKYNSISGGVVSVLCSLKLVLCRVIRISKCRIKRVTTLNIKIFIPEKLPYWMKEHFLYYFSEKVSRVQH